MSIEGTLITDVEAALVQAINLSEKSLATSSDQGERAEVARITATQRCFVVSGPTGSGKTRVLSQLVRSLRSKCSEKDASPLENVSTQYSVLELCCISDVANISPFSEGFSKASRGPEKGSLSRPPGIFRGVIVVDNFPEVEWTMSCISPPGANRTYQALRHLILSAVDDPQGASCVLVLSCQSTSLLPGWFSERLAVFRHYPIPPLTPKQAWRALRRMGVQNVDESTISRLPRPIIYRDLALFAASCRWGLTPANSDCIRFVASQHAQREESLDSLQSASPAIIVHRSSGEEVDSPPVLYGLDDVLDRLALIVKLHVRSCADSSGLIGSMPPCTGVLLHGPSGCGKTSILVKLRALFPDTFFVEVTAPRLFSKYLGESEEHLRQAVSKGQSAPAECPAD